MHSEPNPLPEVSTGSAVEAGERRASSLLSLLTEVIVDKKIDWERCPTGKPHELSIVWDCVATWLRALEDREIVFWAETPDSKDPTAHTLLLAIDREVNKALRAAILAADTLVELAPHQLSAFQTLGFACVMHLRDEMKRWEELRKIPLNEASYEAWLGIQQSASRMHWHVHQLEMQLTDLQRSSHAHQARLGSSEPIKLNVVAGRLLAASLETANLDPDLAANVAQCAREMRHDYEVFTSQRGEPGWKNLMQHFRDPFDDQGQSFGANAGLMPRPLVWPVLPGEEKKSGVVKYRAGVHYKRHSEVVQVQKIEAHYSILRQRLYLPEIKDLAIAETGEPECESKAAWLTFQRNLGTLNGAFTDAMHAARLLYAKAQDATPQQELDAIFEEKHGHDTTPELERSIEETNEHRWALEAEGLYKGAQNSLYLRGDPEQVQRRLAALELEDGGLFDSKQFCLACYRTAINRNYCYLHAGTDPRIKREVRSMAKQFQHFTKLLVAHRKARFAEWKTKFKNGSKNSGLERSVESSTVLYRHLQFEPFNQWPGTFQDELRRTHDALANVRRLIQKYPGSLAKTESADSCVQRVADILNPGRVPLDAQGGARWLLTARSVQSMDHICRYATQLALDIKISQSVAHQFGVKTSAGSEELEQFTCNYAVGLLRALAEDHPRGRTSQQVPDDVFEHFFAVWFYGGAWGYSPGDANQPRDGNSAMFDRWHQFKLNLFAHPETRHDPGMPLRFAQQIERWAVWKAVSPGEIPRQEYGKVEMDEVLELRKAGQSLPRIAATMGVSYDALRMAVLRHERKLTQETAGKTSRPRGRPRKTTI